MEHALANPTVRAQQRAKSSFATGLQRNLVLALATTVAISAIVGGLATVAARAGNKALPRELLAHTPFATYLIPGMLLTIVVGGTSLACALMTWRRSLWSIDATLVAGGALTTWIVVESLIIPTSWLQVAFGALGVTLLALGVHMAWRAGEPRHRWIIVVTCAETVGYLAPSLAGILATRAGWTEGERAIAVVAAGLVEGFALGCGQAWALPLPVRRLRFALLTALGGGFVWAMVMTIMLFASRWPVAVAVIVNAVAGMVGLASIGTAQLLELRHRAKRTRSWIAWTALAWLVALPMSFAPGPFVDESTPLASHVVLWGCGGLLMAFAMAAITWQGVRRLVAGTASA
jgi:hypothetical protein